MPMYVEQLPTYSAERYYLISEIDQKAAMYFLQDHQDERPQISGDIALTIIYTIWNVTDDDVDAVAAKAKEVLQKMQSLKLLGSGNLLIAIDALVPSKEAFQSSRQRIEEAIEKFRELSDQVMVAVSDNVGSLPGLQQCQELIDKIHPGMHDYPVNICFAGYSQNDMLGHDPRMEPSGQNNVFQVACWPAPGIQQQIAEKAKLIEQIVVGAKSQKEENSTSASFSIALKVFAVLVLMVSVIALYGRKF